MADQWYFSWDDNEFGPFSAVQLKELAAIGRLQPTDAVWKQGSEKRVQADRINNLFLDPKSKAVLANGHTPEFSASLQRCENHSSHSGVKLDPWLPSANEQGTPREQDEIPDGLLLRAIAEPDDSDPPAAAPSPPSPDKSAEQCPETVKITPARAKGRARAISGAIITSQDGEVARYRKLCTKCGHKDSSNTVMLIRNGVTRVTFFCTKCKKIREASIEGIR